ncbi:hypothetical protein ACFL27_11840 [candidate division CSSED10-310 bacterium]|uniref:Uncharacterized protein n=1 Tax=candidate division CSSED10-310 bacterium TaxID=2855610 RepID=A0ABV6YXS8_UNCC1
MGCPKEGAQVELVFGSAAVWSVIIHKGKTDWGSYDLPPKLKKLMAEQLGEDEKSFPKTYQDLLKMLHDNGASLTINGTWNALTDVEKTIKGKKNIPDYVQPLTLKEMLAHRAKADQYWSF